MCGSIVCVSMFEWALVCVVFLCVGKNVCESMCV